MFQQNELYNFPNFVHRVSLERMTMLGTRPRRIEGMLFITVLWKPAFVNINKLISKDHPSAISNIDIFFSLLSY